MSWLSGIFKSNQAAETIRDLENWEEETDALLPNGMSAAEIAHLESVGYLVDLETGAVSRDPDADNVHRN